MRQVLIQYSCFLTTLTTSSQFLILINVSKLSKKHDKNCRFGGSIFFGLIALASTNHIFFHNATSPPRCTQIFLIGTYQTLTPLIKFPFFPKSSKWCNTTFPEFPIDEYCMFLFYIYLISKVRYTMKSSWNWRKLKT